jgi:hypothetical protein
MATGTMSIQLLYIGIDVERIRGMAGHPAIAAYEQFAHCAASLAQAREAHKIPAGVPLNKILFAIGDINKSLRTLLTDDGYTENEISAAFDVAAGRCFIREDAQKK